MRVAILSRKSKAEGSDNLSEASQRAQGRRWAEENGHVVVWCGGDNESASGITKEVDLPKRQEALNLYREGAVDLIWVARQDRISREGALVVWQLLRDGYRFYIADRALDTATLDPDDLVGCLSVLLDADAARKFAQNLSANVRATKATMRDAGAWTTKAPYGTRAVGVKAGRRLVPDPATWPVVRRIYEEAAAGLSPRRIAKLLTSQGIPTPSGGSAWGVATVRKILQNPVYEGWLVVKGPRGTMVPHLVNGERVRTFAPDAETIPADLAARARKPGEDIYGHGQPRTGRATHLLTGLTRCAGCGARMPVSGTSYVCGSKLAGKPCPAPASAQRALLEAAVVDEWISRLINAKDDDPLVIEAFRRWQARQEPGDTAALDDAREALADAERRLARLMADRAAGLYESGPAASIFTGMLAEASSAVEAARQRVRDLEHVDVPVDFATAVISAYTATPEDRRALLHASIETITVSRAARRGAPWVPAERVTVRFVGDA